MPEGENMRAAFLTNLRKVEVRETPDVSAPGRGQVLVRVNDVGVCGSDMHYFTAGRIGTQVVQYPFIVGHEFGATVEATGRGVQGLKPGRLVAVDPLVACGQCDCCRSGHANICRNQKFMGCPGQLAGSLVERLLLPAECCFPVPKSLTPERAALVEPFTIGLYAAQMANLQQHQCIGILGSGPIGLCVLAAARALTGNMRKRSARRKVAGTEVRAYVTDLIEARLQAAESFGAEWTANPCNQDVVSEILSREPNGLDAVFECAGEQSTLDQALELLKPGGSLYIVGIPEFHRASFDLSLMRRKELHIHNVRRQNKCVPSAIRLLATRRVCLDALVTHRFTLAQTQQAFDMVAARLDGVIKALIHVS
jgi:L-iditol 2-dehydrogenase